MICLKEPDIRKFKFDVILSVLIFIVFGATVCDVGFISDLNVK